MKTRVTVTCHIDVEHTDRLDIEQVMKTASDSIFFTSIAGCGVDCGSYSTDEIRRGTEARLIQA